MRYVIIFGIAFIIGLISALVGYRIAKNSLERKIGGYIHILRAGTDDPQIFLELTNREDIDKIISEGYVTFKVTHE